MCTSTRIHATVAVVPVALFGVVVAVVVAEVVSKIVRVCHFAGIDRVDA